MSSSRGLGPARPSGTSSGKDEAQNSPTWPSVSSIHSCRSTPGLETQGQGQQQKQSQEKCRGGAANGPWACSSLRMSNGGADDRRMMPPPSAAPRLAPGEPPLEEQQQVQKPPRVKKLFRWRVNLNDDRELDVKGFAEDGTAARSRPITSVISAYKVQSGNRFIYELHGDIVDDHRVLPNYIHQKFAQGFPNDWQNVHRLWIEYRAAKSSSSFRWPTDINDVDDDIQSVVTEYSFFRSKGQHNRSIISPKSDLNQSSLGYHSRIHTDNKQEHENRKQLEMSMDSAPVLDNRIEKSKHSKVPNEVSDARVSDEKSSTRGLSLKNHSADHTDSTSSSSSCSFCLTKFFSEDNRKIIFDVISDGCPPEMMDKFLAMIDFLRFIIAKKENENEYHTDSHSISKSNSQNCLKCNNSEISNSSGTQKTSTKELKQMIDSQAGTEKNEDESSESSDNDALLGVPNVVLDHLLKPSRSSFNKFRPRKSVIGNKTNIIPQVPKLSQVSNHDSSGSVLQDDPDQTQKNESQRKDEAEKNFDLNQLIQNNEPRNNGPDERLRTDSTQKPTLKSIVAVQVDLSCMKKLKRQNSHEPSTVHKETTDLIKKQKLAKINNREPELHEDDDDLTPHNFFNSRYNTNSDSEDYLEENQAQLLPHRFNNEEFKKTFKVGKSICKSNEVSGNRTSVICPERKGRKPLQPQFSSNSSDLDDEPRQVDQVKNRVIAKSLTRKPPAGEQKSNSLRRPRKKKSSMKTVTKVENGGYNMRLRNREPKPQPGVEWTYNKVENQMNQLSGCEDL